jgi:hypothetical protein
MLKDTQLTGAERKEFIEDFGKGFRASDVVVNSATPTTAYTDYNEKTKEIELVVTDLVEEVTYNEDDCLTLHPFLCPTYPKSPLVREHNTPYLELLKEAKTNQ